MSDALAGRTILVTGAGGGVGRGIALASRGPGRARDRRVAA